MERAVNPIDLFKASDSQEVCELTIHKFNKFNTFAGTIFQKILPEFTNSTLHVLEGQFTCFKTKADNYHYLPVITGHNGNIVITQGAIGDAVMDICSLISSGDFSQHSIVKNYFPELINLIVIDSIN